MMTQKHIRTAFIILVTAIVLILTLFFVNRKKMKITCGTYSMMLSDEEKEFLIFNCVDEEATREQIAKGTLPKWKRNLVYRRRQAMEYLNEKYPDGQLIITTYENISDDLIQFTVMKNNEESSAFHVIIDKVENTITDTYS